MYLERCRFITVINRTQFGSFCNYKYFMEFDGVLEWKQNKALGSQIILRSSLCIVQLKEILLSESQTESCSISLAFWGVLLTKKQQNFNLLIAFNCSCNLCFLPSLCSCHSFSFSFYFFWDQVHSVSFCEQVAERRVHRHSVSSLSLYDLTWTLKKRSINYDIAKHIPPSPLNEYNLYWIEGCWVRSPFRVNPKQTFSTFCMNCATAFQRFSF